MKKNKYKKLVLSVLLSGFLTAMSGISVFAAEKPEVQDTNNIYVPGVTSAEGVIAQPNSFARGESIMHYSTVSPRYGLVANCILNGTCYSTLSGSQVSASYSVVSTFYRKDGYTLTSGTKTGSSTSSSAFTWSEGDDGGVRVNSTRTVTTCSKQGYVTVDIINTTTNPY